MLMAPIRMASRTCAVTGEGIEGRGSPYDDGVGAGNTVRSSGRHYADMTPRRLCVSYLGM
jgi:hypothetical protein